MSDVPMPRDLSEEAVARLLWDAQRPDVDRFAWEQIDRVSKDGWLRMARAVRALVSSKVREAVVYTLVARTEKGATAETVVARVMGDHPSNASGGHEPREGREEAPRG